MVVYVPLGDRQHAATYWCAECGALSHRKYEGRQVVTTWSKPKKRG
jgi:hypothetical protein